MIIVIMIAVKGWAGFEMKFTEHNEFRIIYMLLIIGLLFVIVLLIIVMYVREKNIDACFFFSLVWQF